MRRLWPWFTGFFVLLGCVGPSAGERAHDVVVYGATSAGVVAAVQAARLGHSVVLIEPTQHVGGMTSSGLGATDIGNKAAIGGIAREFYRRVRIHYDDANAWTIERRDEFRGSGHQAGEDTAWTFEPHVAEQVFLEMLRDARVEVVLGERLELEHVVQLRDGRIVELEMESGRRFAGSMFIDASYEGDVMALAGISYVVGRESNARYGETLNGVQTAHATKHQFTARVDPFVVPGDRSSGLIRGVSALAPGIDGERDDKVQAYCFRVCATDAPANRTEWPKPADYDERDYELALRNLEAGDARIAWNPLRMPNQKTDSNNNGAVSLDFIGANYDYAGGDWETRERIVAAHREYQQGLLWTFANHVRVPAPIREHFASFGLCRDEFTDNGGWPRALYIREARRMLGEYVMSEHNCRGTALAPRAIGLAAYTMDSHNVQRYVDETGAVRNEGDVQVGGFPPYAIDFGAILPRRSQCGNLLVPVCLSASHIAYGSIRMEPVFMVLGQSAATAACLALDERCALHDIDYAKLREKLLSGAQVLEWKANK